MTSALWFVDGNGAEKGRERNRRPGGMRGKQKKVKWKGEGRGRVRGRGRRRRRGKQEREGERERDMEEEGLYEEEGVEAWMDRVEGTHYVVQEMLDLTPAQEQAQAHTHVHAYMHGHAHTHAHTLVQAPSVHPPSPTKGPRKAPVEVRRVHVHTRS